MSAEKIYTPSKNYYFFRERKRERERERKRERERGYIYFCYNDILLQNNIKLHTILCLFFSLCEIASLQTFISV